MLRKLALAAYKFESFTSSLRKVTVNAPLFSSPAVVLMAEFLFTLVKGFVCANLTVDWKARSFGVPNYRIQEIDDQKFHQISSFLWILDYHPSLCSLLGSAFQRPEISATMILAIFALSLLFYVLAVTVLTYSSFPHRSLPTRTPSPHLSSRHPYRSSDGGIFYSDYREFSHTLTGVLSNRISLVTIRPHPSILGSPWPSRRDSTRCPNGRGSHRPHIIFAIFFVNSPNLEVVFSSPRSPR